MSLSAYVIFFMETEKWKLQYIIHIQVQENVIKTINLKKNNLNSKIISISWSTEIYLVNGI